MKEFWKSFKIW